MRGFAMVAALAALTAACGKGGDVVDPSGDGSTVLDGLAVTAQVVQVEHERTSVVQVTMHVTLTNTTTEPVVRSYPAGCPVLMRFYNAQNLQLVYDEGRRRCAVTTPVQFRLAPQESMTLTSGLRFPWEILGDSLPAAAYYSAALLRLTGNNPVEVDAGVYAIPHCEEVFALPGAPGETICHR